ncbi:MAG: hypothetical protein ACK5RS_12325 [Acidobacteriota bacterium]
MSRFKMWRHLYWLAVIILTLAGLASSGLDRSQAAPGTVTFTRDVAPILYSSCVECHRPGELAPMSLLTYKEVRPWARSIRDKVLTREMPPWYADPNHGEFLNDTRLSAAQVETIRKWVDQGAREGDPRDLPVPP